MPDARRAPRRSPCRRSGRCRRRRAKKKSGRVTKREREREREKVHSTPLQRIENVGVCQRSSPPSLGDFLLGQTVLQVDPRLRDGSSQGQLGSRSRCHVTHQRFSLSQSGDSVPSVDLFEGAPDKKVNLAELTKEGKFILFGVPGAFTPGCSKTHLPGEKRGSLLCSACVSRACVTNRMNEYKRKKKKKKR